MDEYIKKDVGNQNCTELFGFYIAIIIVVVDYYCDGITYVELRRI